MYDRRFLRGHFSPESEPAKGFNVFLNAGMLHSLKGNLSKEIGRRVPKFGPLISWQIQEEGAALQVNLEHASLP